MLATLAQPKYTTPINGLALALALLWLALVGATLVPGQDDFGIYRRGALAWVQSGDPYGALAGEAAPANTFIYPPLLALLLAPLAGLDEPTGQLLWFALNCAALLALVALCIRESGSRLAARYWGPVVLVAAIVPPTRLCLQLGQTGILIALLLVAGLALARRAPWATGLMLALAGLVKLYPGFMALYYLRRRPRAPLWWTAAGGLLLLGVSLAAQGSASYLGYAQRLTGGAFHPYAAEFNTALYGLWARLFVPSHYGIVVADLPWLARALGLAGGAAALGLCLWVGADSGGGLRARLQAGAWLCAMMLASPLNGVYNLTLLVFPLLAIAAALERAPSRAARNLTAVCVALACVPPLWSAWPPDLAVATRTGWLQVILTPPLFGTLGIFGLCLWLARRAGQPVGEE